MEKYDKYYDRLCFAIFSLVCAILVCLFVWSLLAFMGICDSDSPTPRGEPKEEVSIPDIDIESLKCGCQIMLEEGQYTCENLVIDVSDYYITVYSIDGVVIQQYEMEDIVFLRYEKGIFLEVDGNEMEVMDNNII